MRNQVKNKNAFLVLPYTGRFACVARMKMLNVFPNKLDPRPIYILVD